MDCRESDRIHLEESVLTAFWVEPALRIVDGEFCRICRLAFRGRFADPCGIGRVDDPA